MSHLNDTYLGSLSIFLDSTQAQVSINESHKIFFLREIIEPPINTTMLIGLTSFEMPFSMYNINSGVNDSITFTTSSGSYTISIGSGNFSATELATRITTLLSDISTTGLGFVITCSYDSGTNRFIFTGSGNIQITATTMLKELGFRDNIPSLNTSKLISPNIVNLSGSNSVYVRVNNLGIRNIDSRGNKDGTIAKVNINCNVNEFIFYQQQESIYYAINDKSISYLDLELTDELGNDFILNGGTFSLTLTLHFKKTIDSKIDNKYLLRKNLTTLLKNEIEEENK